MTASTEQLDAQVRAGMAQLSGTDPQDWFLLSKARHALAVVLGSREAGEVVTQPMTCLTAVVPILAAGHIPRYADIDPSTLAVDPATVPDLLGGRTRAVIGQHSFAAAAPLSALRELLPEGALLVEDSAHCLGDLARGADGRPVADVSVHSFGVEKILPTRLGAAVWVNPEGAGQPWHAALLAALLSLPAAGVRDGLSQVVSRPVQGLGRRLGAPGRVVVALGARAGVVDTPIMPAELHGRLAGRPTRLGGRALADVAAAVRAVESNRAHRSAISAIYREGLAGVAGVEVPSALEGDGRTLVRFPLLLPSTRRAEETFAALDEQGLVPGRWYRPLLFPGPEDAAPFAYAPGTSPHAEDVSERIVNLPTAAFVTTEMAHRAVATVRAVASRTQVP